MRGGLVPDPAARSRAIRTRPMEPRQTDSYWGPVSKQHPCEQYEPTSQSLVA